MDDGETKRGFINSFEGYRSILGTILSDVPITIKGNSTRVLSINIEARLDGMRDKVKSVTISFERRAFLTFTEIET